MSLKNDHLIEAARRYALACNCAGNVVPCTKCWTAAEAYVDGYYRSIEEAEAKLERKYRHYSETGKKLEP
jgi:hypothetical protein